MTTRRIEKLTGDWAEKQDSQLPFYKHGLWRALPEKMSMTRSFFNNMDSVLDFQVREDDVWVVSYPKAGTTWTQEMVWCICNKLDFEGAKKDINERFPFLELSIFMDYEDEHSELSNQEDKAFFQNTIQFASNLPSPRFIKTHLPLSFLPRQMMEKKPKLVYVSRNPRDVVVSYFYHLQIMEGFSGTFLDCAEYFLQDIAMYSPFWPHVLDFWRIRDEPNILFLKYEDIQKDLHSIIRKVASFLDKPLTDEEVTTLAKHLSFEEMQKNPAVNYESIAQSFKDMLPVEKQFPGKFMRKGKTGSWKTEMTPELVERFWMWEKQNLEGTELCFDTEL